ncbi:GntR family transcriptional regulator, partial [Klebsiella pneumoniae]|nr:GntR family transcriptional regulator [Klebsiella pneumoniae]
MRLTIDSNSGVPPFEQVRSSIAEQVNSGELPVGAKLPTVRALAADLG